MVSIKQSEVELNHSSEQCSELFFKTLGLLFLNGPSEENVQLLTLGLELSLIHIGVVSIGEGAWYQPSPTEKYEAWFDLDGDGKPEKHLVAVDVGGAVNTLTTDRDIGAADPVLHLQTNKSGRCV